MPPVGACRHSPGTLPILTPLAAFGIALVMVGAMARHLTRGNETPMVAMNIAFPLVALCVTWGRFGDYAV